MLRLFPADKREREGFIVLMINFTNPRTCQFSAVYLTVFPFEFRPRTFTIGFYGKNSYQIIKDHNIIRAYDFGVQFSFKIGKERLRLNIIAISHPRFDFEFFTRQILEILTDHKSCICDKTVRVYKQLTFSKFSCGRGFWEAGKARMFSRLSSFKEHVHGQFFVLTTYDR